MMAVSARQEAADAHDDLRHALAQELETLPGALAEVVAVGDFSTLQQTLDHYVARPLVIEAQFNDMKGIRLVSRDTPYIGSSPAWFLSFFRYETLIGSANVTVGGRVYGTLNLTLSPKHLADRAWARLIQHMAILLLAVTLDFIGIWLVLRFGLRPLKQLEGAADALAAGHLDTRIEEIGSPELRHLANAFNRMAESIQTTQNDLREAIQVAETANYAKTRFLATMSHEIRTPMNGVLGMAQLLLLPGLTQDEQHEYARTIVNSGQTLLALLNDILDISKVEAGKIELMQVAVDPQQIIEEVLALFGELSQSKRIKIESFWHSKAGQRYLTDPIRVRQMLSNLVGNAIKFTSEGFVRIEAIEIERSGNQALLEFSVTDSGIGISEDKQHLLFKPFSQVDASTTRDYGGTGLGLSIVHNLSRLMGGNVGVESEPGKGSRFWFRIRAEFMAKDEESRQRERAPDLIRETARQSCSERLVLVVEDNVTNRRVVNALLVRLGMCVESVENGQEAVDALRRGLEPNLVLMDIHMPVMDGFEATREIRRWEAETHHKRVPIIALTADAFEEDRQLCNACGMDDFLTKPINVNMLSSALHRWMGS